MPNKEKLIKDLELSILKMQQRLTRLKLIPDMNAFIEIENEKIKVISVKKPKGQMNFSLDLRLLRRILDRQSHWNNAEIGCHIDINRIPNFYSPDMHTALQFLHL